LNQSWRHGFEAASAAHIQRDTSKRSSKKDEDAKAGSNRILELRCVYAEWTIRFGFSAAKGDTGQRLCCTIQAKQHSRLFATGL